jgi:glycosyltransferase involved in cell wall biosynthesis
MFCSTIIPTIGRSTLARAVNSLLSQSFEQEDFEIIVVNDSGIPLPEEAWQRSSRVQILQTNHRERSVARNTGASVARGRYLHFLDDDDWLAQDVFQHFYELSQSSTAKWLYGITQLVDREGNELIRLQHGLNGNCFVQVMAGEWIPLQSSLIDRSTFMRIGGFNPLISGPEDIDLLRRVLLEAEIAETLNLVSYIVMGELGSTTNYKQHPQASRQAREKILEASNTFQRMRSSAVTPYWHGRMLRVYLTSSVWNIQHRRLFGAFSCLFSSLACMLVAGRSIFSRNFWQAVSKPYASDTFQRGIQAAKGISQLRS